MTFVSHKDMSSKTNCDMTIEQIVNLIEFARDNNLVATVNTHNIMGDFNPKVNYDRFAIIGDKLIYDADWYVKVKHVVSITVGTK